MKQLFILLLISVTYIPLKAQLYAGATGISIASGTPFCYDSLTFTPSQQVTIVNNAISKSYLPVTSITPGSNGSIARVYHFSNPLSWEGIVGIQYSNGELNGNTPTTLEITYHDGINNYSSLNTTSTPITNYVFAVTNLPIALKGITAVSNGIVLPLRSLSFNATKENSYCRIDWVMTLEKDIAYYEVERSWDANHFTSIHRASGRNSNTTKEYYTAYDKQPNHGRNYYRLKITDNIGSIQYSNTIPIEFEYDQMRDTELLTVYPIPSQRYVFIPVRTRQSQDIQLTLEDINGKMLWHSKTHLISGDNTISIDLGVFAAGSYILRAGSYPPIKLVKN